MIDLQSMITAISRSGIHRTNRYTVSVRFPDSFARNVLPSVNSLNTQEDLSARVSRVSVPAVELSPVSIQSNSTETLQVARRKTAFQPISFALILSEDARERMYFEKWLNWIHGAENKFQPLFYSEYTGGITIRAVTITDQEKTETKVTYFFENAWPMSVGDIEYAYAEGDAFTECVITMNYEYYTVEQSET